eukprot:343307-Pleurochrysis_carterae.AAC.3
MPRRIVTAIATAAAVTASADHTASVAATNIANTHGCPHCHHRQFEHARAADCVAVASPPPRRRATYTPPTPRAARADGTRRESGGDDPAARRRSRRSRSRPT